MTTRKPQLQEAGRSGKGKRHQWDIDFNYSHGTDPCRFPNTSALVRLISVTTISQG